MRSFVAVKIPEEIRYRIPELTKTIKIDGVKWVKPENIHLTLKFLGEVNENRLQEVKEALENTVRKFSEFKINLKDIGAFPSMNRPSVIWIGVDKGKQEVISIINELEISFSKIGFEKETRKPHPHITIGRVKKARSGKLEVRSETWDMGCEMWDVKEIYLIQSELRPEGPIYTDVESYKLKIWSVRL